jgi:chemotaxis signal transduction protein
VLVARAGSDEIGILCDEFVDVFFVPAAQIAHYQENEDRAIARTVVGEYVWGDRPISVIEVAGVLAAMALPPAQAPALSPSG